MAKHIAGWADRVLRSGAHEAAEGNGHRNASSSDLRSLDASPGSLFLLGSLVLGEICRVPCVLGFRRLPILTCSFCLIGEAMMKRIDQDAWTSTTNVDV